MGLNDLYSGRANFPAFTPVSVNDTTVTTGTTIFTTGNGVEGLCNFVVSASPTGNNSIYAKIEQSDDGATWTDLRNLDNTISTGTTVAIASGFADTRDANNFRMIVAASGLGDTVIGGVVVTGKADTEF